jgi:hypothetical protein
MLPRGSSQKAPEGGYVFLGGIISFVIFYLGSTVKYNTVRYYRTGSMIEGGKDGPTLLYQGFLPSDAECPAGPILSG